MWLPNINPPPRKVLVQPIRVPLFSGAMEMIMLLIAELHAEKPAPSKKRNRYDNPMKYHVP